MAEERQKERPVKTKNLMIRVFVLLVLVAVWGGVDEVRGNGAYTHVHISQLAVTHLGEGELRNLLTNPVNVNAYEAGSMFPDSGYAAGDDYGEQAHWAPFQEAYLEHLKALYQGDYTSPEAQSKVAFLMGMASHGLADQTYDTTVLARSFEVDGDQSGDVDRLADYFIVVDQNVQISVQADGPYQEISDVFRDRVGYAVDAEKMEGGMRIMEGVMGVQRRAARGEYLEAWGLHPWLGTHLYNPEAPGSLPHLGQLVAVYWEVLWKRLRGEASIDQDLIVGSIPVDGGENFPINADESVVYSRVGVVFGYGIRRSQISDKIRLLDPDGAQVQTRLVTPYNGEVRNFVMLEPVSGLEYNTLYTVEVSPGVESLQGEVSTVAYLLEFRTRCAPDRLSDCPALASPLVTGPIPTEVPPLPATDVENADDIAGDAEEDTASPPDDTAPSSQEDAAPTSPSDTNTPPQNDTTATTTPSDTNATTQDTADSSKDCSCGSARKRSEGGSWASLGITLGAALITLRRRQLTRAFALKKSNKIN